MIRKSQRLSIKKKARESAPLAEVKEVTEVKEVKEEVKEISGQFVGSADFYKKYHASEIKKKQELVIKKEAAESASLAEVKEIPGQFVGSAGFFKKYHDTKTRKELIQGCVGDVLSDLSGICPIERDTGNFIGNQFEFFLYLQYVRAIRGKI